MITHISITNGTIENRKQNPHARAHNWIAVVEHDATCHGELRRDFLARAPNQRYRVSSLVQVGCYLEFAGDYYTSKQKKKPDREYWHVLAVNLREIKMQSVLLREVGTLATPPEPEVSPLADVPTEELLRELARRGVRRGTELNPTAG